MAVEGERHCHPFLLGRNVSISKRALVCVLIFSLISFTVSRSSGDPALHLIGRHLSFTAPARPFECACVCDPLVEPLAEVGESAALAAEGGAALLLQLGDLVQLEQVEPVSFLHGEKKQVTSQCCFLSGTGSYLRLNTGQRNACWLLGC